MDYKITLSFDEEIIIRAKEYAQENSISLSRLIEYLLKKVTSGGFQSMEDFPVSDWVHEVAEGQAEYQTTKKRTRKQTKDGFFKSKK
ncbi:MAG: DUF6364 family protein [Bacteroidota bacterium]|nr:DUF6364 family protein [Bacteroidota bacterium]